MNDVWSHALPAAALGFALGAAPGPVQLLILTQTAKRGLSGGLRVMLGANVTLLAILLALALGLSAIEPSDTVLRGLQVVGGLVIAWIAFTELRSIRAEALVPGQPPHVSGRLPPTAMGVVAVLLNPGAWVFFASTASAVLANASVDAGTTAAVVTAFAMAFGVSASDLTFTILGSGGRRFFGDHGLRRIRGVLAVILLAIGAGFVIAGIRG